MTTELQDTIIRNLRAVIESSACDLERVKKVSSKKICEFEDRLHSKHSLYGKCYVCLDVNFVPYAIHAYRPDQIVHDEMDFFPDGVDFSQDIVESFGTGSYTRRIIDITTIARQYYWGVLDFQDFICAVTEYVINAVETVKNTL